MSLSESAYYVSHWVLLLLSVAVFLYACKKLPLMDTLRHSSGMMYANVILIFALSLFKMFASFKMLFVPFMGDEWVFGALGRLSQIALYFSLLSCIHQCGVRCAHHLTCEGDEGNCGSKEDGILP